MEVSVAGFALSVVLVGLLSCSCSVLNWVWLRPKRLERLLRQQGFQGNSYKLFYGDVKESSAMLREAKSKPMKLSTCHDIAPRVIPFVHRTVNIHGKNSFTWLGPKPKVNITNPEDLKDIFTKYDDFPKLAPIYKKLLAAGFATDEGEKWARHRKIINPAFHMEKLKSMLPAFHQSCNGMIKEWESLVSKEGSCELDVWPSLQSLSDDALCRTSFGSSYEEGKQIFELLKEQAVLSIKALQSVNIPGWRFVPTKMNKKMMEIDKEIKGSLKGIINKREEAIKAGEPSKDDLLSLLLESNLKEIHEHGNNKNFGMSIEEVIEDCKLFYFAGQETTAVLLVWTMILLGQYQNWQTCAREEVLQVFGSNKPGFDGLTRLKIVTMILREVLRLYPAAVVISRNTYKETQLGKLSLPAGVEISLPILLVHHDEELWGDDAKEFKPERFAEGVSKVTKGQLSYFPFGGGPRVCIGQNFAMIEAKLALSLILQHFTFELSPSYAHAPSSIASLQPQYGAHLILHQR
ncbi:cytochrome P450 CYP72A219-like isoform X2 [Rosa rugosa]|uniref:cytochrome P450 CYP72A219-like isoform X2 n=1 Tax=Rosa rugosa TaxID=74645 RepID=UPI002B412675|nr:cytochrome P450 CYP72A219-like isoform X2 [Rosa rugosa]